VLSGQNVVNTLIPELALSKKREGRRGHPGHTDSTRRWRLESRNNSRNTGQRIFLLRTCTYISGYGGPDNCVVAVARYISGGGSADEAESGEEVLDVLHLEAERMYGSITRVV
jgi:hypothetical protein